MIRAEQHDLLFRPVDQTGFVSLPKMEQEKIYEVVDIPINRYSNIILSYYLLLPLSIYIIQKIYRKVKFYLDLN